METCVVARIWLPRGCDARDDASALGALLVAARVHALRAARWLDRSRAAGGDGAAAECALRCASAARDALRAADSGRLRLGPDHVLRVDTDLVLFDALCAVAPRPSASDERARWQRAAGAGERVAASFERLLPRGVWPQRALHWYRVAKVQRVCDAPRAALRAAEAALPSFEQTHGALRGGDGAVRPATASAGRALCELRELRREAEGAAQMAASRAALLE